MERKRRQTARKKKSEESVKRTQKAKSLICEIRKREMSVDEIKRRIESIFGKGSALEIGDATTKKIVERIEELSKREQQLDKWEKMRQDAKRRQREDRRLNLFWRRNKTFPAKYGGEDETPDPQETLDFWRTINNKEVSEGWRNDRDIREAFSQVRWGTRRRICRWFAFTEEEFDEILRCTAHERHAEWTASTHSQLRSARPSRRPCSSS